MLSMKTLRVAIVTMGSALLLGSGLAYGQAEGLTELQLDARAAASRPVQVYALETMAGGFVPAGTTTRYYGLDSIGSVGTDQTDDDMNQLHLAVNVKRRIASTETVFVRLELGGGLVFNEGANVDLEVRGMDTAEVLDNTQDPPTVTTPYARGAEIGSANADFAARTSGGTAGGSFIVFPIESDAEIPIGSHISLDVTDDLAAPRVAGAYTATMTAHTDPDDAIGGVGARSTLFSGSATIVSLTNGLRVSVAKGANVTAEVHSGFLWFKDSPLTAQERLGWVDVKPATTPAGAVHNAANGRPVVDGDLIGEDGIEVIVEGELGIGAFSFIEGDTVNSDGERTTSGMCPEGSADAPDRGKLMERDEDGGYLIDMEGVNSGATEGTSGPLAVLEGMAVYSLCVNVDVTGPETNASKIPETEFTGTVMITPAGEAVRPSDAYEAATGVIIGKIVRNGASVEIPYLTTSEKHNQRLIVVNRGARAAAITDITFTTEDGTEVELMGPVQAAMDAGLLEVPAKSSWVARMDETISITGDSRRIAASVAFAARKADISVATTQVNVSDGSTDTVVYDIDDGEG